MAKIEINLIARTDLANIKLYLRECLAEEAYPSLEARIIKSWQHLAEFPESGTKVKIKKFKNYRYVLEIPYYIFYTYKDDTVKIERIIHAARDIKKILD